MSKFKESDLIVWGDKYYICKIAGDDESVFVQANINGGSWCNSCTETGIILPSDISNFTILSNNTVVKYFKDQDRFNIPGRDPRIGFVKHPNFGIGLYINLSLLRENSKLLYEEYVNKLYAGIAPTKQDPISEVNKVEDNG